MASGSTPTFSFAPRRPSVDDSVLEDTRARRIEQKLRSFVPPQTKVSQTQERDIGKPLSSRKAVAAILYDDVVPNPEANDIWPECRGTANRASRYVLLDPRKSIPTRNHDDFSYYTSNTAVPSGPNPKGRGRWGLPVEIVEMIASLLSRDDIKALRLVSKELDHFVSQVIFRTVLVPFNTEIYGMLHLEPSSLSKGKKRKRIELPLYNWTNTSGNEVYDGHGLDVFKGFGKHILKFGMSFEVTEQALSDPPEKSSTEQKASFWGHYNWPFEDYRRFESVADLETTADETPRMKVAFSELSKVRELALSVYGGLGWLNGPDRSIRARLMQQPPAVFGHTKTVPDRRTQAQHDLWNRIEAIHREAGHDIRLATLYRAQGFEDFRQYQQIGRKNTDQPGMPYIDTQIIQEITAEQTPHLQPSPGHKNASRGGISSESSPNTFGLLYSTLDVSKDAAQSTHPVIPASLSMSQKEWLLETAWAQTAFLASYVLSIVDNPTTFASIHTLNIARLSDCYLPLLNRQDFWDALPSLKNFTLIVLPTWRSVYKDGAGFAATDSVNPAQAIDLVHTLLQSQVAWRSNIRQLTIGWGTGGEHAEGLYARNKLLLPAPLMEMGTCEIGLVESNRGTLLRFPHVEHLTLRNCWITPHTLRDLFGTHDSLSLRHLVLDSVSLTASLLRRPGVAGQPLAPAQQLQLPNVNAMWYATLHDPKTGTLVTADQLQPHQRNFLRNYVTSLLATLNQIQAQPPLGLMQLQAQSQAQVYQTTLQQQLSHLHSLHTVLQPAPSDPQTSAQNNQQTLPNLNHIQSIAQAIPQLQQLMQTGQFVAPTTQPTSWQHVSGLRTQRNSWTDIIDRFSPGTNLSHLGSSHSSANPNRKTSLQSIEFISCGYAQLRHTMFDQSTVLRNNGPVSTPNGDTFFKERRTALEGFMLDTVYPHLGEIVQEIHPGELAALDGAWNLRTGWSDAEAARAVEFDGLKPGGTGRFSGVIKRPDHWIHDAGHDLDEEGANSLLGLSMCDKEDSVDEDGGSGQDSSSDTFDTDDEDVGVHSGDEHDSLA